MHVLGKTSLSIGSMRTKPKAAKPDVSIGIDTVITNGKTSYILNKILVGET